MPTMVVAYLMKKIHVNVMKIVFLVEIAVVIMKMYALKAVMEDQMYAAILYC